ncbi:MAG: class I SAM-dependent methyltransferase [Bacteroidetes bacterium]|nr:class I SAM-dependent methyltransferase [Bacteroidota bacterium]
MHFKDYANYYNLLYKDKDYKAEADYIHALIKQIAPHSKTLIDLGCGTGNHAFEFEKLGYEVTGVDLSSQMVAIANDNKEKNKSIILFSEGDIRAYRDAKKYDAVVSLFHVMSYQTSNDDLEKAFLTAKTLMADHGVFVFDCWYGPGVLSDLPTSRTKNLEDEQLKISRTSTSTIDYNANRVDVLFDVEIENKTTSAKTILQELHPMRYFFKPEIELVCSKYNLEIQAYYNWMDKQEPTGRSWYCVYILKSN